MARAIWKGAISFGLVHIPVDLYPADRGQGHGLDLTMLDKRDNSPVGYKRVNKTTGKEVPWQDIVKGQQYEKGQYVVLNDEDLRRANVRATQTVDIQGFVPLARIPPIYFETPYYLVPGKRGGKGYVLLRETLKKAGKVGIAQVVIRTTQRLAALIPLDDVLVLNTLRYADQIRPSRELPVPGDAREARPSPKEVEMARTLVESMSEDWDPRKFRDTYRRDVLALVEKRIKSGRTKYVPEIEKTGGGERGGKVVDLMSLLRRSVEARGKDRKSSGASVVRMKPHSRRRAS